MGLKQFFSDVRRTSKDLAEVVEDTPVGLFKWLSYAIWFAVLTIAFAVAYVVPGFRQSLKEEENDKK